MLDGHRNGETDGGKPGVEPGWPGYCEVVRGPKTIAIYKTIWIYFNILTKNEYESSQAYHTHISPSYVYFLRIRLLFIVFLISPKVPPRIHLKFPQINCPFL